MVKQYIGYPNGHDQPAVEVLVDGTWWPGQLRGWTQHDDGTWTGSVVYAREDGNRGSSFPADHIRPDPREAAGGRTVTDES